MAGSNSPSQMIRVPTPLIDSVKQLSQLHRKGHTRLILSKLQQLISDVDSSGDSVDSNSDIIKDSSVDIKRLIAEMISSQLAPIQAELAEVKKY